MGGGGVVLGFHQDQLDHPDFQDHQDHQEHQDQEETQDNPHHHQHHAHQSVSHNVYQLVHNIVAQQRESKHNRFYRHFSNCFYVPLLLSTRLLTQTRRE